MTLTIAPMETADIDAHKVDELVAQLSDVDEEKRRNAFTELSRYGPGLWPLLEKTLDDQPAEARVAIQQLLRSRVAPALSGQTAMEDRLSVVSRQSDGSVLFYAPVGVRIARGDQRSRGTPHQLFRLVVDVRAHAGEQLVRVLVARCEPPRDEQDPCLARQQPEAKEQLGDACLYLRDELGFAFLSDISATDYLGWGRPGVSGYIGTTQGRDLNSPMTQGLQKSPEPKPQRFALNYHLLALLPGAPRVRVQAWLADAAGRRRLSWRVLAE